MRARALVCGALLGALLFPACAAQNQPAANNPPPAGYGGRSNETKGEALAPGYPQPTVAAPTTYPTAYPTAYSGARPPSPTGVFPSDLPGADPMFAMTLAEQGIAMSLSSCDVACKALGSMERAVQQICVSDRGGPMGGEGDRCTDAKGRLRRARARVRDACSICPEGPTTDPDAPI